MIPPHTLFIQTGNDEEKTKKKRREGLRKAKVNFRTEK